MFLPRLPKPTTPAERTKYEGWLVQAREAYNDLVTGNRARVFVDQNGERIEYSQASAAELARWISSLEDALKPIMSRRQYGPIGFTF